MTNYLYSAVPFRINELYTHIALYCWYYFMFSEILQSLCLYVNFVILIDDANATCFFEFKCFQKILYVWLVCSTVPLFVCFFVFSKICHFSIKAAFCCWKSHCFPRCWDAVSFVLLAMQFTHLHCRQCEMCVIDQDETWSKWEGIQQLIPDGWEPEHSSAQELV